MSHETGQAALPHEAGEPGPRYLSEFVEHLRREGMSERRIAQLRSSAWHFLVWLERDGTALEAIDDAVLRRFRHHDCRCVRTKRGHLSWRDADRCREFVSGAVRLVRFLEESGRIPHPGELDEGFRLLEEFLSRYRAEGYASKTLRSYRSACRHFLVWLHGSRLAMKEIDAGTVEEFVGHECLCLRFVGFHRRRPDVPQKRREARVEQFVKFLAGRGAAPRAALAAGNDPEAGFGEFSAWLKHHRGISERTIREHVRKTSSLVAELGDDPGRYDARLIRNVLLRHFAKLSLGEGKRLAVAMRMYLRFLASKGDCRPNLLGAVPKAPGWRLSTLPRYLPLDEVERVIDSCDPGTRKGMRDRAVLLLLARLALRAGDVSGLRLSDIDWRNARLIVSGKSKRAVRLPLPQDAGDALLDYIEHARPRVDEEKVFLRVLPPYRPLSCSGNISQIVSVALRRAGVESPGGRGAHLLRHSAATGLLRAGASLESIGALLRHRSPDATTIYAKVDVSMLREVAQPWIGGLR